jgi:sialate O-acetylesterase
MYRIACQILFLVLECLFMVCIGANAAVKLPALISNNMVLQEGTQAHIWGTATPFERVTVRIASAEATTAADQNGKWSIGIEPPTAGGPYEMTIQGRNRIVLHNVMVGEVWLCSGQSNMKFSVGRFPNGWETGVLNNKREIADANYPMIRMFTVAKAVTGKPQSDFKGRWEVTSPVTVPDFSAVAYFFGRDLFDALRVPIGLISSSWGGTPAESWTSLPTLQSSPDSQSIFADWRERETNFLSGRKNFQADFEHWKQAAAKADAEGSPVPLPPKVGEYPRSDPWRPACLFNAMIAPAVSFRINGVIWYQGESNGDRGYQYRKLFPALILDWRKAWGEGDFPFLFVQLASFQDLPSNWSFPLIREAQLMALSLPKTGMVVTIDIGNATSVHPRNKQEVGRRLALAASLHYS